MKSSLIKYDKYVGAFEFVLVNRNNGTIKSLFVCTKKQITERFESSCDVPCK